MMLTLTNLIVPANTQNHFEATPIPEGHGFIQLTIGEIKPIHHYDTIIHHVNVTQIRDHLSEMKKQLPPIEKIQFKFRQISNLLKIFRVKRGLLNVIGEATNTLFGIMSNEDRNAIYKTLENLEQSNSKLINNVNQQVRINNRFKEEFNNLLTVVNKDTEVLGSKINEVIGSLAQKQVEQEWMDNLILLYNFIKHLTQTIMSARSGVVDISLLDEPDFDVLSVEKLGRIRTAVVYANGVVAIIVQVPVFGTENCKIKKVFPIPNYAASELQIEPLQLISCGNKIFDKEFVEVPKDTCLHQIFGDNITHCRYKENRNEKITSDEAGLILAANLRGKRISGNCNLNELILNGNYLIRFGNCTIIMDNIEFRSSIHEKKITWDSNGDKTIRPLLKGNPVLVEELENEEIIQDILIKTTIYSWSGTVCCVILLIFIISVLIYKIRKNKSRISRGADLREGDVTPPVSRGNPLTVLQ